MNDNKELEDRTDCKVAQVKFNGGRGALLCDGCSVIIAYGFKHEDRKHYCPTCMSELR